MCEWCLERSLIEVDDAKLNGNVLEFSLHLYTRDGSQYPQTPFLGWVGTWQRAVSRPALDDEGRLRPGISHSDPYAWCSSIR
jgi:hypothetical protein